jgi:phosphoribosylformylglycinamidine cyclo-ligase
VLPAGTRARIDTAAWPRPAVFDWLQRMGNVDRAEMFRTFNCGVGMVACVTAADAQQTLAHLEAAGETAWLIGRIEAGDGAPSVILEP